MNKSKKIIAWCLSITLLLSFLPIFSFVSAGDVENNVVSYSNDFNVDGDLSKITKDFNLYYDTSDTGENSLKNITSDPSKYMTFANNRLERVRDDSELGYWNDGNRPYWCMAYYTYKNQTFKNFTLTVDAYLPSWGNTYNAITVGSMGGGLKNNGGFTLGFFNSADDVLTVYLGNAADVAVNFNDWYVHDCAGKGTYAHENGNYNFQITLTVSGGKATVSIDGTTVLTDIEVGEISGYVSLVNGLASGSYYDDLSIVGSDESTFARTEEPGKYSNNFDVSGLNSVITNDFNLYYDTFDTWENSLINITSAPSKYMTFENNRLERVRDGSELDYWNDGNRPYWCMAYYTYKNQTFKNFTLTVDAYMPTYGNNYNAITVGSMGDGLKSNGGFTLGFFNDTDDKISVYLGNAADVAVNFNDWYVHDCAGKATYTHENGNFNYRITLTVSGGRASVAINESVVLSNIDVGKVSGYVSLVNGLASGSYYDNLSITENEPDYTRIEEEGKYSNNFNVEGDLSKITNDFNLYYDTFDTWENSLINITSDPSKYMTFDNNRLERVHDDSELSYWNDGNRPYWCMAYYTYKNQTFKDFTLTVDAYLPTWGTSFNAITVGSMGGGLKSNGGFTLGFFNGADDVLTVYLGSAADVAINFNDWCVGDCDGKALYAHENGKYNYKIALTVVEGSATVIIDGKIVLSDIPVGVTDGYVSLVNGIAGQSYYDDLSIIDYDKIEIDPSQQSTILSIEEVDDVNWDRTEDNNNVLKLPEKLKITTDKGESECKIKWTSDDYKPNLPGTYQFIGTPRLPVDKTIVNPHGIVAQTSVTVTVDYDTSTTVKYYIDSLDDFKSDWVNMYSKNPRSEDYVTTTLESTYYIDEGRIRRLDSAGIVGDHDEINSLIYTGRIFRNFQLDVDFRQGTNTWGQAMVVFGIEDTTTYVTMPGGGAAAYLTMEGNARFRGLLVQNTSTYGELNSPSNFKDYADTWGDEMHHMTIRVTKLKAIFEVDGVEVLECSLDSRYKGGYIGLMSNKNTAIFDNLTVTTLDYDGNVITLEEHDNLPDTFDPNDPLIGEEENDGSPVEIIGIAYKKNPNGKYLTSSGSDTIEKGEMDSSPETGDKFPFYILTSVLVLSCLVLPTTCYLKKHADKMRRDK